MAMIDGFWSESNHEDEEQEENHMPHTHETNWEPEDVVSGLFDMFSVQDNLDMVNNHVDNTFNDASDMINDFADDTFQSANDMNNNFMNDVNQFFMDAFN